MESYETQNVPFYFTQTFYNKYHHHKLKAHKSVLHTLYMMLYYVFKKCGGIQTGNVYLDEYVRRYITADLVLDINRWTKNNEGFIPPDPYTIERKMKQCEEILATKKTQN